MKSYLKPFRQRNSRQFKEGSTFEEAYNIYKFDAELRKMICSELEKIEVSIRTQLSLIMGNAAGIYWFENPTNFRDTVHHSYLLRKLSEELHRSDDDAIVAFIQNYSNPFPPSWMTFEVSSFGTLSMMYRWLKAGQARRQVAKFYGLSDSVMESWLHTIVYIRNICAHHSRLWNRRLSINAIIPRRTQLPFITIPSDTKKVFYVLSIILYFLQTVNPNNTFSKRFKPTSVVDLTVSYKINRRKVSHTIAFEGLNILDAEAPQWQRYDLATGEIRTDKAGISLPNIFYRLDF